MNKLMNDLRETLVKEIDEAVTMTDFIMKTQPSQIDECFPYFGKNVFSDDENDYYIDVMIEMKKVPRNVKKWDISHDFGDHWGKLTEKELFGSRDYPLLIKDLDEETPFSIIGPVVRADWYRAGEGYCGDFNPEDPYDKELLRFDIYRREEPGSDNWVEVDDASYCTCVPVFSDEKEQIRLLKAIYKEYADVLESDPEASVKKLGEALSWIA